MASSLTRILVTGGDGILAHALKPFFPLADYCGRETCDVTNAGSVRNAFQQLKPELVIHCAAVTSHNAEPMAYVQGNIQGTINVAVQATKHDCRVVFLSTDYLGAHRERDMVSPVNAYAASKYAGECVVQGLSDHLIIRGSWYSRLNLSHAATDAFTTKLPVDRAAFFVATLAVSDYSGRINIGGVRRSIYECALEFNERVIPISRHQLRLDYELPADCSLDTTRLTEFLRAS